MNVEKRVPRRQPEIVAGGLTIPVESSLNPLQRQIDELIALLSKPTQQLNRDEYLQSLAARQQAVDKFLFRGGSDKLRDFFDRIRQLEDRVGAAIALDLSMLDLNGKLLTDLYLPGANLEKIIITDSDLTNANLHSANLTGAIGVNSILRGADLRGAKFVDGLFAGVDLTDARAMGARFINTDLTDAKLDKSTNFAGSVFIGTYLRGTNLELANIPGITVRGVRR